MSREICSAANSAIGKTIWGKARGKKELCDLQIHARINQLHFLLYRNDTDRMNYLPFPEIGSVFLMGCSQVLALWYGLAWEKHDSQSFWKRRERGCCAEFSPDGIAFVSFLLKVVQAKMN